MEFDVVGFEVVGFEVVERKVVGAPLGFRKKGCAMNAENESPPENENPPEQIRRSPSPVNNPCALESFNLLTLAAWLHNDDLAMETIGAALAAGFCEAAGLASLSPSTLVFLGARAWERRAAGDPAPLAALACALEIMTTEERSAASAALLHALHNGDAFNGLMAAGASLHPSWLEAARTIVAEEEDIAACVATAISTASGHGRIAARARSATAIAEGGAALVAQRDNAAQRFADLMARRAKT